MKANPMLFVSWAPNLGGVPSVLYTRMKGLRELGVPSECFFYRTGAGLETFADYPTYIDREPKRFLPHFQASDYVSVSMINFTHFLTVTRQARFKGRVIYEIHGLSKKSLEEYAALTSDEVSGIVVPSEYVAGLVQRTLGHCRAPIHVVPNGVDTDLFRPIKNPPGSFVSHNEQGKRIVLWVGRLDPNKNWPELLEIADLIHKRNDEVCFWVVGDTNVATSDVRSFAGEVEHRGLSSYIRILSCVPHRQMPYLYSIAALSGGCLLSTSKSEGHPVNVVEAMACGCPVVSSAVGGSVEIVAHDQNGKLYPLGHPEMAAACVEDVMENASSRTTMIQAALDSVATRYDHRQHAQRYLEALGLSTR